MVWLGGNAWLGAGCALGGARAPCEALLGRVLDGFGQGHHARDVDGHHAQDCAVTAHVGQRAQLWLELAAAQSIPETTTVWLSEAEDTYGVPTRRGATDEERRARLATWRRGTDGRAVSILAALRQLTPHANVYTNAAAQVAHTIPRATMHLAVTLGPSFVDARIRADARVVVERMLPMHWTWTLGRNFRFRCDDPESRADMDLLTL